MRRWLGGASGALEADILRSLMPAEEVEDGAICF